MKAMWIAALISSAFWAEGAEDAGISVCVEAGSLSGNFILRRAQGLAGKIFADIDVPLVWHSSSGCPADSMRITLSQETPSNLLPGAFAYALPYEGAHIVVFYDRLSEGIVEKSRLPPVLAHILVHEIAHVLIGTDYHSPTGIMKAHWDRRDYAQMAFRPLTFTPRDVTLIRAGLARRHSIQPSPPETSGR